MLFTRYSCEFIKLPVRGDVYHRNHDAVITSPQEWRAICIRGHRMIPPAFWFSFIDTPLELFFIPDTIGELLTVPEATTPDVCCPPWGWGSLGILTLNPTQVPPSTFADSVVQFVLLSHPKSIKWSMPSYLNTHESITNARYLPPCSSIVIDTPCVCYMYVHNVSVY